MAGNDGRRRPDPVPLAKSCDVAFEGLSRPIRFLNCAHMGADLAAVFPAWRMTPGPVGDVPPVATVAWSGRLYRVTSPYSEAPKYLRDPVNALCDVAALLPYGLAADRGDRLWVHAAAVRIAGRLVLLPATRRAGKSVLSVALAARGADLFADDVVAVTAADGAPLHGHAAGVAPRLRLPLPEGLAPGLAAFIDRNASVENRQYRYLDIPGLPDSAESAQFGAVILLDRQDGAAPALAPCSRGAVLARLLYQHFTRDRESAAVMAALHLLAATTRAWTFTYSDPDRAAAFLMDRGADLMAEGDAPFIRVPDLPAAAPEETAPDASPDRVWQRVDSVLLRRLDDDLFAVSADGRRIVHLDAGAQRIWTLLEEPTSQAEARAILGTAFPEADPDRVAGDVADAFARLRQFGMIR